MIRIDSATQLTNNSSPAHKSNTSPQSTFGDLFAEQVAKVAEADKNKQAPVSDIQLTSPEFKPTENPRTELERLLAMSPMELIRYQILEGMGLTEEALQELPLEERMKIEEKIQEQIDRQLGGKAGGEKTAVTTL